MRNAGEDHRYPLWCFLISQIFIGNLAVALAVDSITPTQPLAGNRTLVSSDGLFELGFFTPNGSGKSYVGIWYKEIEARTVVWVGNRDAPLTGSAGILKIGEDGNIHLVDGGGNFIWSPSNQSAAKNTVAQLLDSGNFVLRREDDENPENYLWQSFDYPTDTLLPGMKLGWDSRTGLNRYISAWKSLNDPGEGSTSFKMDINGFPEIFLRNRDKIVYRSGPWNGVRFSGVPEMKPTATITFSFVMTKSERYYTFELHNKTLYSRLLVNRNGILERYAWIPTSKIWSRFWYAPKDQCDSYKECGTYGICDTNMSPVCQCLVGFKPKNPQAWDLRDGSDGCVRYHDLDCRKDGFLTMNFMKLPDTSSSFVDTTMNLDECMKMCKNNCSCTAYTNSNISNGGSGCVIWTTELLDMRQYAAVEGGQAVYIRVAASDVAQGGNSGDASGRTKRIIIIACGITVGVGILLFALSTLFILKRRQSKRALGKNTELRAVIPSKREYSGETMTDEFELPLFDFSTIVVATDNFADVNKLGQGGFGCVYKGMVEGEEIAVKRLSKNSGQGVEEFKNELRLIARLQHRNLVRLLGCCVDMEEKILIYEYMENKSLDSTLFNKQRSSLLNWQTRFNIICGIARGLLYLHQDSRFRIIHRDLKASNILLDKEMNPKISDFGMARIFGGDETEANNTKRVVGTYGYMSPEYAMDGLFSVKSDVFSFGVLVLEIVTGKKNRGFYNQNNQQNLLGHAWRLWRERRGSELLDSAIGESYSPCEVMRCIQVGLLCVQEQAEDRPNMATVVLMLGSESATLPQPKHPGFCLGSRPADADSSTSNYDESCTVNQVTVTMLDGR
ncbi:PREDICTED: receptor-like serine/threonine-protein kinase SD1-8 isoform X2 [Ipomoea nil]|uniref:receptor-like serine/threonine-protein kinase SD1-8 isoform X2 n=1 Tax=Ipomoea nil TaxID=35883 RepID=UPI0009010AAE|nr:PREDICTED: receptor-like serine/threonine-protein kinase SD1-8 isoform X2 [Ipomoea nil]